MPKYGTVSQVLLQLRVVACFRHHTLNKKQIRRKDNEQAGY